jgi:hypothetical protein
MSTDSECLIGNILSITASMTYGEMREKLDAASNSARRIYFKSQ